VDKNNFISLLNHYSRCSVSEALEVLALKQKYPYSQILHALSAKVSKDHGFSTQQQELQSAAVHASDRAVLKDVMSALHEDYNQADAPLVKDSAKSSINKVNVDVNEVTPVNIISSINSIDVTEAIVKDLKQLNKSRRDFESMFADSAATTDRISGEKNPEAQIDGSEKSETGTELDTTKASKSKKERIIELAKAKAIESTTPAVEKTPIKKRGNTGDILIEEIASTKKEINPETEKQKEQIQTIDQFIKAQPIIVNSKEKPLIESPTDLSTIKSGEFGDNIVSETLVDILIKQGKKDKAVEVLKKLIWKFPQKKAYFAAQIEELKK
jgi:hypothetical protein